MSGQDYEYWNSGRIVAIGIAVSGRISSLRRRAIEGRLAKPTATLPDAPSMVTASLRQWYIGCSAGICAIVSGAPGERNHPLFASPGDIR
jgi:hypothetical protein